MTVQWGLTLSSEEHPPGRLVEIAQLAEEADFDFVSISDHYHPWVSEQGHAAFVWSVLGAIANATDQIDVAVGVTCPIIRIHPAILAQAAATTETLLDGRFTWGVGTGENLNEHILGDRWPPQPIRLEMLEESLELIRRLWTEESVTHYGSYFTVEDARVFDRPDHEIPIVVSAFGSTTARKAAEIGDGLWTSGVKDVVDEYRNAGGKGHVYSQLTLCWGEDVDKAKETAHRLWAFSGLPGQLNQDLRTVADYEEAVKVVSVDGLANDVPCGPDLGPYVERVAAMLEAGVDRIYFHQIGSDQEGFIDFWNRELKPALIG